MRLNAHQDAQADEAAREVFREKIRANKKVIDGEQNTRQAFEERRKAEFRQAEALANARLAEEIATQTRAQLYNAHMKLAQVSLEKGNFLALNKELLKADFALNADGGQYSDTVPSIEMSFPFL
jgi:hypothetical protein